MWEFCIEANKKNIHLINYISERMADAVSLADGVQSVITLGNTSSLAIGCEQKHKRQIEGVLRMVLCDAVCEKMKFDFLKKHINLIINDEKLFDAFVKVYTYFDSEIERKIVLRSLFFSKKIVLESFLDFRLQPLRKKWEEMCNLTNSNSNLFLQSETFIELLKFLISNLESKSDCLVLDLENGCNLYEEKGNKIFALQSFDIEDDINIVTSVIELCPNKIKIMGGGQNSEIVSLIGELFYGRVEIVR